MFDRFGDGLLVQSHAAAISGARGFVGAQRTRHWMRGRKKEVNEFYELENTFVTGCKQAICVTKIKVPVPMKMD